MSKCKHLWNLIRQWHEVNGKGKLVNYWEFYCQFCLAIEVRSDQGKRAVKVS